MRKVFRYLMLVAACLATQATAARAAEQDPQAQRALDAAKIAAATQAATFVDAKDLAGLKRVAVVGLANDADGSVAEVLTIKLTTTKLTVLARADINKVLDELAFTINREDVFDAATIKKLGNILAADCILFGTVREATYQADKGLAVVRLHLKLADVEKGTYPWAATVEGKAVSEEYEQKQLEIRQAREAEAARRLLIQEKIKADQEARMATAEAEKASWLSLLKQRADAAREKAQAARKVAEDRQARVYPVSKGAWDKAQAGSDNAVEAYDAQKWEEARIHWTDAAAAYDEAAQLAQLAQKDEQAVQQQQKKQDDLRKTRQMKLALKLLGATFVLVVLVLIVAVVTRKVRRQARLIADAAKPIDAWAGVNQRLAQDRARRSQIVGKLRGAVGTLRNAESAAHNAGQPDLATTIGKAIGEIASLATDVDNAPAGDKFKVKKNKVHGGTLDKIAAFDTLFEELAKNISTTADAIGASVAAGGETQARIDQLKTMVAQLRSQYSEREATIRELN